MLNEAWRPRSPHTAVMTCPYRTPASAPTAPTLLNAPTLPNAMNAMNAAASPDLATMQSFYSELSKRCDLQFDLASGCWLASSPELAQAALVHPDLGVRPPGQAVPPGLQNRPFGAVFARWLRMRDDGPREAEKAALQYALEHIEPALIQEVAKRQADIALSLGWSHWQWASIPCTVAQLLGLSMTQAADQQALLAKLASLALALKLQAQAAALAPADQALAALLAALDGASEAPLAAALQAQAQRLDLADRPAWWQAQALALLWQAYEAGAALMGQALLQATRSATSAPTELTGCAALLDGLARQGGAIHHTRRWAMRDCVLADQALLAGDAVLVILAGGAGKQLEALGYGMGRHRCPGIALSLAAAAAALLCATEQSCGRQAPQCLGFETLANARIPILSKFTSMPEPL